MLQEENSVRRTQAYSNLPKECERGRPKALRLRKKKIMIYVCIYHFSTYHVCVPHQQACVGLSATSEDPQPQTTAPTQKPQPFTKVNLLRPGKHL